MTDIRSTDSGADSRHLLRQMTASSNDRVIPPASAYRSLDGRAAHYVTLDR